MPATPALADHLSAIRAATDRMQAAAIAAGPTAAVPSCPEWTVADLLAHVGMVHRWARAQITGSQAPFAGGDAVLAEIAPDELPAWLGHGADELIDALASAPADLDAWVFIETGLTPLEFWARRQSHETTVHAMDAVGAEHGTIPPVSAWEIPADFAADGVDELLVSFIARGRSKLYEGTPFSIAVTPDDVDTAWTLRVTEDALHAERIPSDTTDVPPSASADVRWTGSAAALYFGLWNRGHEIISDGDPTALENWRGRHRIRGR